MADTEKNFYHLSLPLIYRGRPKLNGRGQESEKTLKNLQNRKEHSEFLKGKTNSFMSYWKDNIKTREEEKLPPLPKGIPLLLEIDPHTDIDYLRSTFGFEIVSEHDDGYVIVACDDIDFKQFLKKIEGFANETWGTGNTAKIHDLHVDDSQEERLKRLLTEDLLQMWGKIEDQIEYIVDVGIECLGTITLPNPVERKDDETEIHYKQRLENYHRRMDEAYIAWDNLKMEREEALEKFVYDYQGEILSYIDGENLGHSDLPDSFTSRIKINGKGLRDLVYNFPFLFEVSTPEILHNIKKLETEETGYEINFDIIPPDDISPAVCVIDSGIQEEHKLIDKAIDKPSSHCYLPGVNDSGDHVPNGGHGTRVAGAVLYPSGIPRNGTYKMPCWLQNARVLDHNNSIPEELFPPNLLRSIIKKYHLESAKKTRLYNHSIASFYPCRLQHMSAWAAEIDNLSYEHDVLFLQAAGNIHEDFPGPIRVGIIPHLLTGKKYPRYLLERSCRIPNPAQSLQALTVGSICNGEYEDQDKVSLGKVDWPSPFSATGPGIWNVIKPDVVEYGGGYVIDKGNPPTLTCPKEVCPELVRTSPPGPAYDSDEIGTSFSATQSSAYCSQTTVTIP